MDYAAQLLDSEHLAAVWGRADEVRGIRKRYTHPDDRKHIQCGPGHKKAGFPNR